MSLKLKQQQSQRKQLACALATISTDSEFLLTVYNHTPPCLLKRTSGKTPGWTHPEPGCTAFLYPKHCLLHCSCEAQSLKHPLRTVLADYAGTLATHRTCQQGARTQAQASLALLFPKEKSRL